MARVTRQLLCFLTCFGLIGCEALSYYSQAIHGHFKLYHSRIPLKEALSDARLTPTEHDHLAQVPDLLAFANNHLHLPTEKQYQSLVFLEHPVVTWNVFAAPHDSLTPKTWCFIVVGCLSYRGYFAESAAKEYAEDLSKQGWETYVGGASAYSTLGWFKDPILSTFLQQDVADLAGLLFHELAHQQLYIANDTTFNESFATAVEIAGVKLWQQHHPALNTQKHFRRLQLQNEFLTLAMSVRADLKHLYAQKLNANETRAQREKILADFRTTYEKQVSTQWDGLRPYGNWMKGALNNAQWNTLGAYYDLVPAFQALLKATGNDFSHFYTLCKKLGDHPKSERDHLLAQCAKTTCPDAILK